MDVYIYECPLCGEFLNIFQILKELCTVTIKIKCPSLYEIIVCGAMSCFIACFDNLRKSIGSTRFMHALNA